MLALTNCHKLNNGVEIPCLGLGTWQDTGETAEMIVSEAIKAGYRHIDTAAMYFNEDGVGRAVKNCGIKREEIFVTSKLQNDSHGYENTVTAFENTMKSLDMDYIDLYLIHWPNPIKFRDHWQEANAGSWKAMEEFYKAGRIRALGLSNFHPHHIDELMKTATVAPTVNQIRLCPGDTQDEVVKYCREHGMILEAYSPFGIGKIFSVPEMQAFAEKYKKSVAQVCVRWSLQMGFLPLPKTSTAARLKENLDVFDFELSAEDVSAIAGMEGCCGTWHHPDNTKF